jgi:hypothetical protein
MFMSLDPELSEKPDSYPKKIPLDPQLFSYNMKCNL